MENRHEQEARVERSRLELLALLGSAGAAAACTEPTYYRVPNSKRAPSKPIDIEPKTYTPLTPAERKELGLDKEGGEGGGGGDGGGH